MKKHILILGIILCSLGSGIAGGYIFDTYIKEQKSEKVVIEKESPSPKKEVVQTTPAELMQGLEQTITKNIENTAPSVVSIVIKKDLIIYRSDPFSFFQQPAGSIERQVGGGTGFFVRSDGTIITNKHVISDPQATYTVIVNTGEEYDARVIATDPLSDLAIIKIDADISFATLPIIEDTQDVTIGQFAIAIGNALAEFQNSVSLGIVSGKERSISAQSQTISGLIQTDTAINPGNSGGPLINLQGEVIGINTAVINNSEGIGFAIALTQDRIEYMLESIAESGKIKRPFIGINYVPNSPGVQQELGLGVDYGAYIIDESGSVIEGSSAENAGIEPGDIILEIDNTAVTLKNDLGSIIQNKIPGEILSLKILKKSGKEEVVELKLGEL